MTGFPQLIGCGEYVPGTRKLPEPNIFTPTPPRTITIWQRTPTLPPLPRRDDDEVPPVIRFPDPANPAFDPLDPINPFYDPPQDPDPDPTIIIGIPPNTQPDPEPPRRTGGDPELIIGIGGQGLDEPGGGGTGGDPDPDPTLTMGLLDFGGGNGGNGGGGGGEDPFIPTLTMSLQDSGGGGGPTIFSDEEQLTLERSIVNPNTSTENTGTDNFPGPQITNTLDLRENAGRSMFSNSFSQNNMYDPIYNILDHSQSPIVFVENSKHRDIFANRVAREVHFLLEKINSYEPWEERFITGLTFSKLMQSLNSILLEAFDTILDINGVPVSRAFFINKVFKHLVSGTLDEFDSNYYIRLADSLSKRTANNIVRTANEQTKKHYALSLISKNSLSADPDRYVDRYKIEVARMRFLLTDLESTFDVETIDGTEYKLQLEDAGVEVDYAPSLSLQESSEVTSDYVPPGEGDGYYYKIETELGDLLPLVLDTELQSSYFMKSSTRNLALNLLDLDPSYTVTTTVDLINSELSSGYYENYTASAHYFKLDLRTIQSNRTTDNFIENITANYVKLTDPEEIRDHSKTYGAKVVQFNLQHDDPFLQYADRSGIMTLNMVDITFRSFTPKRTPSNSSIITRNLPDGFIVYPVNTIEDNPLGAYSEMTSADNQVTRSLKAIMDFSMLESDLLKRSIPEKLVYDEENSFRYGLIGIDDTENIYYVYDPEDFPNNFSVAGRTEVGNLLTNIIKNTLEQKYSFDYLTWWDLYRRMPVKDFSKLVFNFPSVMSENLYQGWLGYPIQDVLYRGGQEPDNLIEVNPEIPDPIYLDGRSRNNV